MIEFLNLSDVLAGAQRARFGRTTFEPSGTQMVAIPYSLARQLAGSLSEHIAASKAVLRVNGAAVAAGECDHCRLAFFNDNFGDIAASISQHDFNLSSAAAILADLNRAINATAATTKTTKAEAGDSRKPASGDGVAPISTLLNSYDALATAMDKLDPLNDLDGPKFVALYRRSKEILAEVCPAGIGITPPGFESIRFDKELRVAKLQSDYQSVAASVAAIGTNGVLYTAAEERRLGALQQREQEIVDQILALDGEVIKSARKAA